MTITDLFLELALLGAEWVLWLLVALSVVSIGVMIDRAVFFGRRRIDTATLIAAVRKAITRGEPDDFAALTGRQPAALAVAVAAAGISARAAGPTAAAEAMQGARISARAAHEANLVALGTLGNNAPFIGLLGTVLGIIGAFDKLAGGADQAANAVMSDIAQALVATAVGLLVALPAVVAFNYFNRRVRARVAQGDEIAHVVLAALAEAEGDGAGTAA